MSKGRYWKQNASAFLYFYYTSISRFIWEKGIKIKYSQLSEGRNTTLRDYIRRIKNIKTRKRLLTWYLAFNICDKFFQAFNGLLNIAGTSPVLFQCESGIFPFYQEFVDIFHCSSVWCNDIVEILDASYVLSSSTADGILQQLLDTLDFFLLIVDRVLYNSNQ